MDKQWEVLTLKEVCARGGGDIQTGPFGSQLHAEDYVKDGIPSVMPQNIGDNRIIEDGIARISSEDAQRLSRYLLREGDVVYSRRGDIERRALVRSHEDGWLCGTGCLRVRFGNDVVVPEYAAFYLATHDARKWLKNHAVGATMPNLNTSILGSLPFILPPLSAQRQIADILSAFEDKIELNRQMNRTLEQMARALFKSWFIDFDPVHAKQRGEQPAGMDAETAALFPDGLVEIDGKEVPEGWEWKTVDQLYTLRGGSTPSTSNPEFWEGGTHAWTSPKDLSGLTTPFLTRTEKRITEAGTKVISSGVLPEGTVLLSSRAPVGYLAIASMPVSINQGYIALESTGALGRYFTLNLLQARLEEIKAMASGTTFPELSKKTFRTFAVLSPPRALCDAFEGAVSGLYEALLQNVHEIDQLASLRDSLLPRLLSGELDVSDWENAVEAPEGTLA